MSNDAAPVVPVAGAGHAPTPAPASFSGERRRVLRRLQLAAQLTWIIPLLAFAVVAALLYRQHFIAADQAIERASRIAQEQALKLFETNAMLLQRMLDLLGDASDEQIAARGAEIHDRLKRMAAELPQVQGLFINSSDGRALTNSVVFPPPQGIDYKDREWYQAHRSGQADVFFTEQLTSRVSGEPFFDMSVRRSRADRSFGGTVHVSLRPSYLTDFYAELAQAEPGLRFAVARGDGRLLARWPDAVQPGTRIPAADPLIAAIQSASTDGVYRGASPIDGVDRLRRFRQLSTYPLYVLAGIDSATVRAAWLRDIGLLALFAVPAVLMLTWMARLALIRTRRQLAAAQRLDDETALRQRMEVALLQSQKLEALGRLTGGVAHDFNNVLMVITSNLYVHRLQVPHAADSAQLAAIERAVGAGTKLTRQLLAFTRRQALVPQVIHLQHRLPALLELLTPLLGKNIELTSGVAPNTAAIHVDPAELELALINLAVNAKDAMPDGGQLDVSARPATPGEGGLEVSPDGQSGFVVVEVADNGSGIAPQIAARVFEPFFTTKPVGQGTGLGLSQVQALCQAAGGSARIAARLGGGTRVQLFFPAVVGDGGRDVQQPATDAPRRPLRCRVLLVEDNDAVARATCELLEAMGCAVRRAAGGGEALARIQSEPTGFDLVLSDIEMPGGLDGIALADKLRERSPQMPVLLLTGYAERLQQAAERRYQVLPKPVAPATLADAIDRALSAAAARHAAPTS